MTNYFAILIM